jgi:hypothetical protein
VRTYEVVVTLAPLNSGSWSGVWYCIFEKYSTFMKTVFSRIQNKKHGDHAKLLFHFRFNVSVYSWNLWQTSYKSSPIHHSWFSSCVPSAVVLTSFPSTLQQTKPVQCLCRVTLSVIMQDEQRSALGKFSVRRKGILIVVSIYGLRLHIYIAAHRDGR